MQIDTLSSEQEQPDIRSLITQLSEKISQIGPAEREANLAELQSLKAQLTGFFTDDSVLSTRPDSDLRQSEARYRSLFEQMSEGFALHEMVFDEDGKPVDYRFLQINPAFERLTGLKSEDVIGRLKTDVLPDDTSNWIEIYGRVAKTGESIHFENYSTALRQHYEVFAYQPAPGQFATLFINTTERKLIEHEAQEGKHLLDVLMEFVPVGITIADAPDAHIQNVSKYGLNILGGDHRNLTLEEVNRRWKVYHPDGLTEMALADQPLMRAIQNGETIRNEEITVYNSKGDLLSLLCNAGPILGEDGAVTGGIVAWNDITERRRDIEALREAEEALRISDERFRLASQAVQGIIYDWDIVNDIVFRSEGMEQVTGFQQNIVPQENGWWQNRIHPDEIQDQLRFLETVFSGMDETYETEYRIQHKEGHWVNILDRSFIMRDKNGKPVRMIGSANAITDQKRYEASLLAAQKREQQKVQELEAMLDATPAFVWISHDRESRMMTGNRAAYQSLRMQPGENISKSAPPGEGPTHIIAMKNGKEIPAEELPVQMAAAQGISIRDYEFDLVFEDGDVVCVIGNSEPLFDEDGNPRGAVSAFIDITERKRVENALRESEAHFALTLENTSILLFNTDRDLRFTWFHNPTALGQGTDPIGKRIEDYFSPEKVKLLTSLGNQVIETGQRLRREVTLEIEEKPVIFDLILGPLCDEIGNVIGITGAASDITQTRQLEQQQLEQKTQIEVQRRLQEYRERERREIARDIHDGPIQTLMSALINIQLTKEVISSTAIQLDLESISATVRSAVHELREVVNQLRPPALIRFGLARSISLHAQDFQDKHPNFEIKLDLPAQDIQMPEDLILTLFRIYQEALNNVVRHSHAKNLRVRYSLETGHAVLEIQDDGLGFIVPNDLLQQTQLGHYGLAGMRERAEAVGGLFQVESEPGSGTTIFVNAPIQRN